MATRKKTAAPAASKSEQMRKMFVAGQTVNDVARKLGVPYSFAYGVAKRALAANIIKAIPAEARSEQAPAPVAKKARATKASTAKAPAKRAGRPSAKRRQANRKPRS